MNKRQITYGFWLAGFIILFSNCNQSVDKNHKQNDTDFISTQPSDTLLLKDTLSKEQAVIDTPSQKLPLPKIVPPRNEAKGSGSAPGSGRPQQEPNPELRRYQQKKEELRQKMAEEQKGETGGKEITETKATKPEAKENTDFEVKPK